MDKEGAVGLTEKGLGKVTNVDAMDKEMTSAGVRVSVAVAACRTPKPCFKFEEEDSEWSRRLSSAFGAGLPESS